MRVTNLKPFKKQQQKQRLNPNNFHEMRPLQCDLTQETIIGTGVINMHGQVVQFMPLKNPWRPKPGDKVNIGFEIKIPFKPMFFTKEGRKG